MFCQSTDRDVVQIISSSFICSKTVVFGSGLPGSYFDELHASQAELKYLAVMEGPKGKDQLCRKFEAIAASHSFGKNVHCNCRFVRTTNFCLDDCQTNSIVG